MYTKYAQSQTSFLLCKCTDIQNEMKVSVTLAEPTGVLNHNKHTSKRLKNKLNAPSECTISYISRQIEYHSFNTNNSYSLQKCHVFTITSFT